MGSPGSFKDQLFDSDRKRSMTIDDSKFLLISDKAKCETAVGGTLTAGVKLCYKDTSRDIEYEITKEVSAQRMKEQDHQRLIRIGG